MKSGPVRKSCPNKTLQGIYAQWVWPEGECVERRSRHVAVFESGGWDGQTLMQRHRQVIFPPPLSCFTPHHGGEGDGVQGAPAGEGADRHGAG